jgi:hypothetical protein
VGQLFVDTRITMLAERARLGRTADIVSGFRMIQAVLRTDCKSGGKVSTGDGGGATDSTTAAIRQELQVRSEMRARRVRRNRTRRHGLGDVGRQQICRIGGLALALPHT